MKKRSGFTMLELLFVIVVVGIMSKFGVEFLFQAYRSFIFSSVNNVLQAQTISSVELIAKRLQHRIKGSTIARDQSSLDTAFVPISDATGETYIALEWIGEDSEGFRGNGATPYWSGILDFDAPDTNDSLLVSVATDTSVLDEQIKILSHNTGSGTTIDDAAIYFQDCYNILGFGWAGAYNSNTSLTFDALDTCIHPINKTAVATQLSAGVFDFDSKTIPEYYQLAWTAYALVTENYDDQKGMGTLYLYYDYQPWNGEKYSDGKKALVAQNVSAFRFRSYGTSVKVQLCIKSDLIEDEEYALCKDKTIY
jgi:prepilin-type N-terminal cleavage/methylation domain-containing protein